MPEDKRVSSTIKKTSTFPDGKKIQTIETLYTDGSREIKKVTETSDGNKFIEITLGQSVEVSTDQNAHKNVPKDDLPAFMEEGDIPRAVKVVPNSNYQNGPIKKTNQQAKSSNCKKLAVILSIIVMTALAIGLAVGLTGGSRRNSMRASNTNSGTDSGTSMTDGMNESGYPSESGSSRSSDSSSGSGYSSGSGSGSDSGSGSGSGSGSDSGDSDTVRTSPTSWPDSNSGPQSGSETSNSESSDSSDSSGCEYEYVYCYQNVCMNEFNGYTGRLEYKCRRRRKRVRKWCGRC